MKLKSGKNIRLFNNPFLESMTFVHPFIPGAIWAPVIIYGIYNPASSKTLSLFSVFILFILGFFVWTFTEYILHRFMFHFEAKSSLGKRIIFLIHGIHHDDPDDQRRLLMPPVPAILLASILFVIFYLFLGKNNVFPFFSGFLVGYLCYDYIHFLTHFGRYPSGIMKTLQQNHMKHHFRTDGKLYGVSSPLWDHVFKTNV